MGGYDPTSNTQQWTAKLYALAEELQRLRSMPRDHQPPTPTPVMNENARIPLRGENLSALREALLSNNKEPTPGSGYQLSVYILLAIQPSPTF